MVGSMHGSPRGRLGAVGGAANPSRPEHMGSILQCVDTLKRDAGRASAGAQLCCSGAGALRLSNEISGCGQDSSAPAGGGLWLIYGAVIARIMALFQQPQCSPRHPSPGWDRAGWVSVVSPRPGGSSREQAPHSPLALCRRQAPPSQRPGGRAACLPGQRVWEGLSAP